jgi:hypothetical protein
MTNIININEPYIKYTIEKDLYTFKVSMANLIDKYIEHQIDTFDNLCFFLHNPDTGNSVKVILDRQDSHLQRVYVNKENPDRIIKLIVQ